MSQNITTTTSKKAARPAHTAKTVPHESFTDHSNPAVLDHNDLALVKVAQVFTSAYFSCI